MKFTLNNQTIKKSLNAKTFIIMIYIVMVISFFAAGFQIFTKYFIQFYFPISDFENSLLTGQLMNVDPIKSDLFDKVLASIDEKQKQCQTQTITQPSSQ